MRFDLLSAALATGFAGDRTPAFTLNLFDDAVYSVEYERFEQNDLGHQTWVGRIVGDPLSTVTLTWKGDVLSGGVQVRDALYSVRGADGRTVIEQLDPGSFGEERPPLIPPTGAIEVPLADEPARLAAGEVVDVFVYYTAAARAGAGGQAAIEALIAQGVSESNTVYARSNVQATMRLVGTGELAGFVESATDMSDDLRAFTSHATVAAARNAVQADLMHLVVANTTGNTCGIAWLGPNSTYAHGVTARQCFSQFTFTHEAGHNFGNQHAPEDYAIPTAGFRPYSFGYKNCGAGPQLPHGDGLRMRKWRQCQPHPQPLEPRRGLQRHAERHGLAEQRAVAERGVPDRAGLSRRCASSGAGRAAQCSNDGGRQHHRCELAATGHGSAVSNYIIQAGTAPGASNIYSGGVGAVTSVSSPIPNGTYYIRVAAQNLAGVGPVSADVVAQVGLPPGPPQNAVATASGGVITLSWTPPASGGAVSTYIVQAGTASGAANVFNGAVGAGTAVSGAVAPGTYYLRVLAQGAGGTSAPSNETSVSVGAACTTPSAPVLSGSRSGNVVTIAWSTPPGGPITGYTVVAGSAAGASDVFSGSVGLTNTVSAEVASGPYFIRVVANAACGSGAASNEVLVTVP